jgi:periplasmic divalent cation tolerance protein
MNPSEFCIVFVTVPDATLAQMIAHTLLEQNLAACVNYFPVQSIYQWQGQIHTDSELQLVIKTQTQWVPTLQVTIQALHTDEVPEMLTLPIATGFPPYLDWLRDNTTRDPDTTRDRTTLGQ